MPHYFFHLRECGTVSEDEEGIDLRDLEAARHIAVKAARDVMSGEVRAGRLCLSCEIAITGPDGGDLMIVAFREAITLAGA